MLEDFQFAAQITTPIFLIVLLGVFLKRQQLLTDEFARLGSDLVFKIALPALLFVNLVEVDFRALAPLPVVLFALGATMVAFLILDQGVARLITDKADRGVFVQGASRSNMGIIGLACCLNAFGEAGAATAALYVALLTIMINILSVITLSHHRNDCEGGVSVTLIIQLIIRNPLIISIVLAMIVSLLSIPIPNIAMDTGQYLARMTMPLALLCAGASIRWQEFNGSAPLYYATVTKLLLVPGLITAAAALAGFRGMELGVLYLMTAAPTAAASYPMSRAMGANFHLAAAIIAATTLASMFTTTIGLFTLRSLSLL